MNIAVAPIAPGAVLGTARTIEAFGGPWVPVDVVAGPVLATGVRDFEAAATKLFADSPRDGLGTSKLVAFTRNGDAWDAVQLLHVRPGTRNHLAATAPSDLGDLQVADGVPVDAIWWVSDFGPVDTRYGTPASWFPSTRP